MISSISSCGAHSAATLRQNRAATATTSQDTTSTAQSPAHYRKGHIPPGLARAAERIASRIFERADTDGSETVTHEELSTVHSRHARALLSSDLFRASTSTPEGTAETPTQGGVTEAQLKDALTKFFYAKVGITYTPPATPPTEQTEPTTGESTSNIGVQAGA